MAVVVGSLTWWGSRLAGRIQNNMGIYWFRSLNALQSAIKEPNDWIYRFRTHRWYRAFHTGFKKYFAPAIFAAMFAYLGLALASHALFNIQDYAGWVCRDTGTAGGLEAGEKRMLAAFQPSNLCQDMKVSVEKDAKYLLTIKGTKTFRDDDIEASKGIYFLDPPGISPKLLMAAGIPLRRELTRPWFRIVARFGSQGGEETFLDPDPDSKDGSIAEVIQATRNGELYLFVNDAVLGIPGLYGYFYGNNHGAAEVTITRQKSCFVCPTEKTTRDRRAIASIARHIFARRLETHHGIPPCRIRWQVALAASRYCLTKNWRGARRVLRRTPLIKHQPACKPGSVWPAGRDPRDVTAIPLVRRLPGASSNLPE